MLSPPRVNCPSLLLCCPLMSVCLSRFNAKLCTGGLSTANKVEDQVRSSFSSCGICGGRTGAGTRFPLCIYIFPCQYHSTITPYLLSSACCSCQKMNLDEDWEPSKKPCFSENRGAVDRKVLSLFLMLQTY